MEAQKEVFYIYDERMLAHKEYVEPPKEGEKKHINPEIPERVTSIHNYLRDQGHLARMHKLEVEGLDEIE